MIKLISLALYNKCVIVFGVDLLIKLIDMTQNRDTNQRADV